MQIKRNIYLNQLVNARQNGFIKVVTGPRRCGKSYLLKSLFHNHLLSEGVDESHIIEVDLGIAKCHFEIGAGKENFEWV